MTTGRINQISIVAKRSSNDDRDQNIVLFFDIFLDDDLFSG